ncbi:MAG: choice-of-anchor D domain-containing protein, partial [Candidatus Acidiferrum sp.]
MAKIRLLGTSVWSFCALSIISQGGGCLHHPKPLPSVTISPNPVSFPATALGASSTPIPVTVTNSGTAALIISSIVPGGSNPGDFTSTNTCSKPVASMGACTITVTFIPTASGPRSETITLTDNASDSPQVINVTGTANANVIAISLTPPQSAIATDQAVQFTASGDPAGVNFSLAAFTNTGPGAAAPPGTINATGYYTPPPGSPSLYVLVTATSKTDPTKSATATVNVVAPGVFTPTNNVQVAQYSVSTAASANVSVQFGLDTTYGLTTWTLPTGQFGGPISSPLYVAGMKQSTPYHMRGVIQFADGTSFDDSDFTFTTGALQAALMPNLAVTTTPGMTAQPGVELLDLIALGAQTGQY